MRQDERHLVEVPRKQLSRLSHLVHDMRQNPEKLQSYSSFDKLAEAALEIDREGVNRGFARLLVAISDVIMDAVYPE